MNKEIKTNEKWIVWSPEGKKPPSKVYPERSDAVRAADALAMKHEKRSFFVLEARTEITYNKGKFFRYRY